MRWPLLLAVLLDATWTGVLARPPALRLLAVSWGKPVRIPGPVAPPDSVPVALAGAEHSSEQDSELDSEAESEVDSELDSEQESQADSELDSELDSEQDSEADSELDTDQDSEQGSEVDSGQKPEKASKAKKKKGKAKKKKRCKECRGKGKKCKCKDDETTMAPTEAPTTTMPTPEPTLSPSRYMNYAPVASGDEKIAEERGPTPPPPRDCVRQAGLGGCNCKEIIDACAAETFECDVKIQAIEHEIPQAARDNYVSKMDHPLFNTLLQANQSRARRNWMAMGHSLRQPIEMPSQMKCQSCFMNIAKTMPHPSEPEDGNARPNSGQVDQDSASQDEMLNVNDEGSDERSGSNAFLQRSRGPGVQPVPADMPARASTNPNSYKGNEPYEPEEFGWRIFDEAPDWDAQLQGECTREEIKEMEACLSYFWSCDANRQRLDRWVRYTLSETQWVNGNPNRRIGFA